MEYERACNETFTLLISIFFLMRFLTRILMTRMGPTARESVSVE